MPLDAPLSSVVAVVAVVFRSRLPFVFTEGVDVVDVARVPDIWQQLFQSILTLGQSLQAISQVGPDIHKGRASDDGSDHGRPITAVVSAEKESVLAPQRDRHRSRLASLLSIDNLPSPRYCFETSVVAHRLQPSVCSWTIVSAQTTRAEATGFASIKVHTRRRNNRPTVNANTWYGESASLLRSIHKRPIRFPFARCEQRGFGVVGVEVQEAATTRCVSSTANGSSRSPTRRLRVTCLSLHLGE